MQKQLGNLNSFLLNCLQLIMTHLSDNSWTGGIASYSRLWFSQSRDAARDGSAQPAVSWRDLHPHTLLRTLLKSEIHRAAVTHCELNYEVSCAIDEDLLDASGICENEQVHICNIHNGERFITYTIRAARGNRMAEQRSNVPVQWSNPVTAVGV